MDSSQQNGSEIARMIWIVGAPIIFTIGVFGNIMTIIVLFNKRNKTTSSTIFLTFLAVADLLVMTIMLPRWWLIYLLGFDIRHIHNIACKIHFFISFFATSYSASILAALTIERTICTVMPYRVKTKCTSQVAKFISLALAVSLTAIYGHILVGMKLYEVNINKTSVIRDNLLLDDGIGRPTNTCESVQEQIFKPENEIGRILFEDICKSSFNSSTEEWTNSQNSNKLTTGKKGETMKLKMCWYRDESYGIFFSGIHQTVTTFFYLIIPEAIFLVGGIIIARSLQQSRNLRLRMRTKGMHTPGRKQTFETRANQITLTLLLVNIVFVITTSPSLIFRVGVSSWVDEDTGMTMAQEIVWAIVNLLTFFNHSINFILYFLSGYRFRRQVLETFNCLKKNRAPGDSAVSLNPIGMASVSSNTDLS